MDSSVVRSRWSALLGAGLAAGAGIACMDNFAFEGEVSPIIVGAMRLAATRTGGSVWGRRGWVTTAAAWARVPLSHVVKHALGLPDTLHPNPYVSIRYLAWFTLVVALTGLG